MAVASDAPDGNIYLFGGFADSVGTASMFNPSTGTMSSLPGAMPGGPTENAGAGISNGYAYVVGGDDPTATTSVVILAAVDIFSTSTHTWQAGPPLPVAVTEPQVAVGASGQVYAFGGFDGTGASSQAISNAGQGNPGSAWSSVAAGFTAREGGKAVTGPDGKIYVFGGDSAPGVPATTAQVYDPASNTWSSMAPMPNPRTQIGATLGPDGKIYAIGGVDYSTATPTFSNEVDQFDPTTGTWSVLSATPLPKALAGVGVGHSLGANGDIFTFGGYDSSGSSQSDIYSYAPASGGTTPPSGGTSQSTSVTVTTGTTTPPGVLSLQVQNPSVSFGSVQAGGSAGNVAVGDLIYNDTLSNSNAWSVTAVATNLMSGANGISYSHMSFTPGAAFTSGTGATGPLPTAGGAATSFTGTGSSSLPITIAMGTTTTRGTYTQTGSTMSLNVPAGAPAASYTGQVQYTITG